jgi:hypothetical protein
MLSQLATNSENTCFGVFTFVYTYGCFSASKILAISSSVVLSPNTFLTVLKAFSMIACLLGDILPCLTQIVP